MQWFQRHLNWTYVLANLSLSLVVWAEWELRLVGFAMWPIAGWIIIQKGRSLWWLLLAPVFSPLWLTSKKTESLTNTDGAAVKFFQRRWFLLVILILGLGIIGFGTTLLMQQRDIPVPAIVTKVTAIVTKVIDRDTTQTAVVTRVIDGDTIEIEGGQRVRYIGIDTPEKGEYFFEEATAKNSELVLGKEVRLEKDVSETDQYGRLLRYVYAGDLFVNTELVRLGYAREAYYPPDTKYYNEFIRLEKYAVASDLGLHNEPIPEPINVPFYRPPQLEPKKPTEFKGFGNTETEPTYKANEVIEVVKASVSYFADAERSRSWVYPLYTGLTCSVERQTLGAEWRVIIEGYRSGYGHFSETWYFHEDTGEVNRSPW